MFSGSLNSNLSLFWTCPLIYVFRSKLILSNDHFKRTLHFKYLKIGNFGLLNLNLMSFRACLLISGQRWGDWFKIVSKLNSATKIVFRWRIKNFLFDNSRFQRRSKWKMEKPMLFPIWISVSLQHGITSFNFFSNFIWNFLFLYST